MNIYNTLALIFISMSVGAVFTWIIAIKYPSQPVKDKIERDSIRDKLSAWYARRDWVCVEVIPDHPGFMGMPTRAIVIEGDHERVRLICGDSDITEGTKVKLRLRTDDEMRSGVWISVVDEFMALELETELQTA